MHFRTPVSKFFLLFQIGCFGRHLETSNLKNIKIRKCKDFYYILMRINLGIITFMGVQEEKSGVQEVSAL